MARFLRNLIVALLVLGTLGGCAQESCHRAAEPACASGMAPMVETSPTPGVVTLNCPELPPVEQVEQEVQPAPAPGYRVVSAEACQCLAAASCTTANLLAEESRRVPVNHRGEADPVDVLKAQLQALRAIDHRNQAAGVALEVFYRLIEAGMQRELLQHSLAEINQSVVDRKELAGRGIALAVDETELARQKAEVLDQHAQIEQMARQAAARLSRFLGLAFENGDPLSPSADLTVSAAPVDVSAAVVSGLAHRADLAALRLLCAQASEDTLALMESELEQFEPLLGLSSSKQGLLHRLCGGESDDEVCRRQQQLHAVLTDRTREAEREIHHAVRELQAALRQVALAKERLESRQDQVLDLKAKREAKSVSPFEIMAEQLKANQAESDLVHTIVAWKIAEVRLRLAQGLLAWECGYRVCE